MKEEEAAEVLYLELQPVQIIVMIIIIIIIIIVMIIMMIKK